MSFVGRIGVARADITPPIGIRNKNWGASEHDFSTGVHQPLTATILTLQEGDRGDPLVLASLDLGWWRSPETELWVREGIFARLGIDPVNVLVCLSHTHAGPSLNWEGVEGGEETHRYLTQLRTKLGDLAQEALANSMPARLEWSYGVCGLAINRDEHRGNRFVCGIAANELADDTLLLGRVTSLAGGLIATILNYACHPTTLAWDNTLLSPDYIGAAREMVEQETGALCLFVQGASGDLAPKQGYTGDVKLAEQNGRCLGYAALSTLTDMLPAGQRLEVGDVVESGAPIGTHRLVPGEPDSHLSADLVTVEIPIKPDLPTLAEIAKGLEGATEPFAIERLQRQRQVRQAVGEGSAFHLPVPIWRVGDAIFVGTPAEPYSRFQVYLRSAARPRPVLVANVANGWYGYLPPATLYGEDIYSVHQTPFGRSCLERVTHVAMEKIKSHGV